MLELGVELGVWVGVAAWSGHAVLVAGTYYLTVTNADLELATCQPV